MNPALVAMFAKLFGLDPVLLTGIVDAAAESKVSIDPKATREYFANEGDSFYTAKAPKGFYVGSPLPAVPNPMRGDSPSKPISFYYNPGKLAEKSEPKMRGWRF